MFRGRNMPLAGNFKDWDSFGDAKAFIEAQVLPVVLTSIGLGTLRAAFLVEADAPVGWAPVVRASQVPAELREMAHRCNLAGDDEWTCFSRRTPGMRFNGRGPLAPLTNKVAVLMQAFKSAADRPERAWLVKLSLLPGEFVDLASESKDDLARGEILFFTSDMLGETPEEAWECAVVTRRWKEAGYDPEEMDRLEAKVRRRPDERVYRTEVPDTDCDQHGVVLSPGPITADQAQWAWNMYVSRCWNNPVLLQPAP